MSDRLLNTDWAKDDTLYWSSDVEKSSMPGNKIVGYGAKLSFLYEGQPVEIDYPSGIFMGASGGYGRGYDNDLHWKRVDCRWVWNGYRWEDRPNYLGINPAGG